MAKNNEGSSESTFGFLKGNVLVMTVTRIFGMFSRKAAFPYASLYILALGGTTTSVGLTDSLRALASLLIFPIAGFMADRSGRVKLIVLAECLSALTYLFFIFANNWIILALGNFIQGMIVFHFPAQSALMADSVLPKRRGIGFATSLAIPGIISVVAPYFAGSLIDEMGVDKAMRYLYTLLFVSYLISAAIQLKFLKDTVVKPKTRLSLHALKTSVVESYRSIAGTIKWMPRRLRALALIISFVLTANSMVGPFWVVYGTRVIDLSASEWGLLILISSTFRMILSIPAGAIVDRFGRRKIIIASFLICILPILYFSHAQGFIEVLLILLMLSTTNAFLGPACSAYMADTVPKEIRGRVMAALGRGAILISTDRSGVGGPEMGFIFAVPVMIGAIMGGYIFSLNPIGPWLIQAILMLGSLIISLVYIQKTEKAEI